MTNRNWNQGFNQDMDASIGLIYRLNRIWERVELAAANGDFEKWNAQLDRIFCNLLYKDPLEIVEDEEGIITEVLLSEKDQRLYDFLNKKYVDARKNFLKARKRGEMVIAKEEVYSSLVMKDVGLRKFMYQLKLYLKQSEKNPAHAMWGG